MIKRPLLSFPKSQLVKYAKSNNLSWREDPSNHDLKYRRNYIRYQIVPSMSSSDKQKMLKLISQTAELNNLLDRQISSLIKKNISYNDLDRLWFTSLPHKVAKEVLLYRLRQQGITGLDRKQVELLSVKLKTHGQAKRFSIDDRTFIKLDKRHLALQHIDR